MSLVKHAEKELRLAGLFDKDSDYGGMLAEATMRLIKVFADEGHSGCSASMARHLFNKLSNFEELTPITNKPDEWNNVTDLNNGKTLYQSKRNCALFSEDLKTYYHVDKPKETLEFKIVEKK